MDESLEGKWTRLVGQLTYKRGLPSEKEPPPPSPPPMSVGRCEEDRLLVLDTRFKDATGDVLHRTDGPIGGPRISGRLHTRQFLCHLTLPHPIMRCDITSGDTETLRQLPVAHGPRWWYTV